MSRGAGFLALALVAGADPRTEQFPSFPSGAPNADVRQILGRPGEV